MKRRLRRIAYLIASPFIILAMFISMVVFCFDPQDMLED